MASTAKAERRPAAPSAEDLARRTLTWGAAVLGLGLALVGAGADEAGILPALAGLLLTIYGIHSYGRLGPDDGEGAPTGKAAAREAARNAAWNDVVGSGLLCLAGLVVPLGTPGGGTKVVLAYAAILFGGFRLIRAVGSLNRTAPAPARTATKVEKRRDMDKSPPP